MIVAPANFITANQSLQKIPVLLIEIATYTRAFVTRPTGEAGQVAWVESIEDLPETINDLAGGADLGELTFTISDRDGLITADFPVFVFEGKAVTLKTGFVGLAQADFALLFTGVVDTVSSANDNNSYTFTCVDNMQDFSKNIFTEGDDGRPTDDDHPRTILGHPIDIFIAVCEDEVGKDPGDINTSKLLLYRDTVFAGLVFSFRITDPPVARRWLEEQLMRQLGGYMRVNNQGQVDVVFFYPIAPPPPIIWGSAIQYGPFNQGAAQWIVTATTAQQHRNADASILLLQGSIDHTTDPQIRASVSVPTNSDDDFVGFVFGYQGAGAYYLIDWKKVAQTTAPIGLSVKKITGTVDQDDLWDATGNAHLLASDPTPYQFNTLYTFIFNLHATGFDITVSGAGGTVATFFITDSTYTSGQFGLYDYSQEAAFFTGIFLPGASIGSAFSLNDDNLDDRAIPLAQQADLVNSVLFSFDKDSGGTFQRKALETYALSTAKYGQFGTHDIEADGMASGFQAYFLAAMTARLIFYRYGLKNLRFDELPVFWTACLLEPGDIVDFSCNLVPDREAGVRGISGRLFEVLDITRNFNDHIVELTLLDAAYLSKFGNYLIAPDGMDDYTAASSDDQEKYMYQSNDDETYSDSTPAHVLG